MLSSCYQIIIQLFDTFCFSFRCCRSHTRCRSTPQRRLSLCWVVWRWMTRRSQRLRCRSSRTQAANWKRVFLTSNRTFHCLNDAFSHSRAYSRMCAVTLWCLIIHRNHWLFIFWTDTLWASCTLYGFVMLFSCLLPQVFCCRYCRPKPREAPLARPSMPSTVSTPCSATETHTSPKSSRSVSPTSLVWYFFLHVYLLLWHTLQSFYICCVLSIKLDFSRYVENQIRLINVFKNM